MVLGVWEGRDREPGHPLPSVLPCGSGLPVLNLFLPMTERICWVWPNLNANIQHAPSLLDLFHLLPIWNLSYWICLFLSFIFWVKVMTFIPVKSLKRLLKIIDQRVKLYLGVGMCNATELFLFQDDLYITLNFKFSRTGNVFV